MKREAWKTESTSSAQVLKTASLKNENVQTHKHKDNVDRLFLVSTDFNPGPNALPNPKSNLKQIAALPLPLPLPLSC